MTRKEEIERAWFIKEVQSNHRYDEKTFREAVEWADKTMIDKISIWVTERYEDDQSKRDRRFETLIRVLC